MTARYSGHEGRKYFNGTSYLVIGTKTHAAVIMVQGNKDVVGAPGKVIWYTKLAGRHPNDFVSGLVYERSA